MQGIDIKFLDVVYKKLNIFERFPYKDQRKKIGKDRKEHKQDQEHHNHFLLRFNQSCDVADSNSGVNFSKHNILIIHFQNIEKKDIVL